MALVHLPPFWVLVSFWDFWGLPFPFSSQILAVFWRSRLLFGGLSNDTFFGTLAERLKRKRWFCLGGGLPSYLCPFTRANFLLFLAYGHVWWHGASVSCHQTRLYVLTQSNFRRLFLQPIISSGKYRPHKDTSSGR